VPAVPAGERSAGGMGAMAVDEPPPGAVVEVAFVAFEMCEAFELDPLDGVDGEELQAARPSAPAAPIKSAAARGWRRRRDTGAKVAVRRGGARAGRRRRGGPSPPGSGAGPGLETPSRTVASAGRVGRG